MLTLVCICDLASDFKKNPKNPSIQIDSLRLPHLELVNSDWAVDVRKTDETTMTSPESFGNPI